MDECWSGLGYETKLQVHVELRAQGSHVWDDWAKLPPLCFTNTTHRNLDNGKVPIPQRLDSWMLMHILEKVRAWRPGRTEQEARRSSFRWTRVYVYGSGAKSTLCDFSFSAESRT